MLNKVYAASETRPVKIKQLGFDIHATVLLVKDYFRINPFKWGLDLVLKDQGDHVLL